MYISSSQCKYCLFRLYCYCCRHPLRRLHGPCRLDGLLPANMSNSVWPHSCRGDSGMGGYSREARLHGLCKLEAALPRRKEPLRVVRLVRRLEPLIRFIAIASQRILTAHGVVHENRVVAVAVSVPHATRGPPARLTSGSSSRRFCSWSGRCPSTPFRASRAACQSSSSGTEGTSCRTGGWPRPCRTRPRCGLRALAPG